MKLSKGMKPGIYFALILMVAGLFGSCKKDDGASQEDITKANEFKAFIATKEFQISEYYSDHPIDYDEDDDTVKAETNLWEYVSPWIKDDLNSFDLNTGKVTIQQNAVKIPGNDADVLIKDFSVGADKDGAYFNFLNYMYEPLKYHLVEFTDTYFTVYADWHSGAKVYTKFIVKN